MNEIFCNRTASNRFDVPVIPLTQGSSILKVAFTNWCEEVSLDIDLEVSYDGGETWMYGGGCKGAMKDPNKDGVELILSYQKEPSHIKGSVSSMNDITSLLRINVEY